MTVTGQAVILWVMLLRPTELQDGDLPISHRPKTTDIASVEPLMELCKVGKLYEVEAWIAGDHPIQFEHSDEKKLRKLSTPLQIAVSKGFHSLAALLLANGYDPNGDYHDYWSAAIRAKDYGMIDLLFRFGADPGSVDFADVLETYDRRLMDHFIEAGVDPCAENAVARALRHKGRPLLGFIKTYWNRFPGLQHQIDIALHGFTDDEDEKGVALMLWLGADPFAVVPDSPYPCDAEKTTYECAFECSLSGRNKNIIAKFLNRPIPRDRVRELFCSVAFRCQPEATRELLKNGADPNDVDEKTPVLRSFITAATWNIFGHDLERDARGLEALEIVLAAGARWNISKKELTDLRRSLLHGETKTVTRIVELLQHYGAFEEEQIADLTRTPTMKELLRGERVRRRNSFFQPLYAPPVESGSGRTNGYWKRHWSQR